MYLEPPRRVSTPTKYRLAKAGFGLSFVGMFICLYMIASYGGFNGDQANLKLWLAILTIIFVIGMLFGVAFYYYRARMKDADTGLIELETLASLARRNDKDVDDK